MNIILVPGSKNGKGQIACLSHRHLILLAVVGLLALPVFVGALTYKMERLIERSTGSSALAMQERILAEYEAMATEFKFEVVDTIRRSVEEIQQDLRARIEPVVRRPRKVDVSRLDPKTLDAKVER